MFTTLAQTVDIGEAFKLKENSSIGGIFSSAKGFRGFISALLPNVFVIAGLILVFLIVMGGLGLVLNAGNAEAQQKNKDLITNAVLGFVLVFAAYWIIQIIQAVTKVNFLGL